MNLSTLRHRTPVGCPDNEGHVLSHGQQIIPLIIGIVLCLPISIICLCCAVYCRSKGTSVQRRSGRSFGIAGIIITLAVLGFILWDPRDFFEVGFRHPAALREAGAAIVAGFSPALVLSIAAIAVCNEPGVASPKPPICQKCKYDLRGVESGRCPECGDTFSHSN